MNLDPTLFGQGPYPANGPLAVLARLAAMGAIMAIILAAALPPEVVPDLIYSHNLQHFAAFYVAMLTGLLALPVRPLHRVMVIYIGFATVLEAAHLPFGAPLRWVTQNWIADLGGILAAAAPIIASRLRKRFKACRTDPPAG